MLVGNHLRIAGFQIFCQLRIACKTLVLAIKAKLLEREGTVERRARDIKLLDKELTARTGKGLEINTYKYKPISDNSGKLIVLGFKSINSPIACL